MKSYPKIKTILFTIFFVMTGNCFGGEKIEIPSSFNPVGSGARAVAVGGAFIAVADDATAASWNPGGLVQLKIPELSIVGASFHRIEETDFAFRPESSGTQSVSETDLNYMSLVYPFEIADRNMVVSLTYQNLFDFNREWDFSLFWDTTYLSSVENYHVFQDGNLNAIGISYCAQIIPLKLSAGLTLNFWDDDLIKNEWRQRYHVIETGYIGDNPEMQSPFTSEYFKTNSYSLNGFNANLGFLWKINKKLTMGGVFKTPFTADIEYSKDTRLKVVYSDDPYANYESTRNESGDEEMEMPMSFGLGILYQFTKSFALSVDIYRTQWNDFVYRDKDGVETSPISGKKIEESDIDPTHQVRIGMEYLWIDTIKRRVIPIRLGLFYDPAPAEGSPDDIFGFSIGSGFIRLDRFSFDIAYQYRRGDNIAPYPAETMGLSQNLNEHKIYLSLIYYWKK